jgi:hypothetical protein
MEPTLKLAKPFGASPNVWKFSETD